MSAPQLKLHYFSLAGRAEATRLVLTLGGVPFEDVHVSDWPSLKPSMPFGQLPVLEVDGKKLAQSGAIERYAAKLAGLMPEDAWEAALADQAAFVWGDVIEAIFHPFIATPAEQRAAMLKELLTTGAVKPKLEALEKLLSQLPGEYVAGPKLTWADIHVFTGLSVAMSGMLPGLGMEMVDPYPATKAFHAKIGNLPAVRAYYEAQGDKRPASFRPAAPA